MEVPAERVKVVAFSDSPRDAGIPLASLNPDINGDGTVEPWEKEIFDKIVAADTDNTGKISVRTLFELIIPADGIPITSLNPDSDGDGKVEKWEVEVYHRIMAADKDQSGSISQKELFSVIKDAAESDRQKRLFARLLAVAVAIIFILIGAMLGMGIVAGEAVKESHVSGGPARAAARRRLEAFGTGPFLGFEDEYRRLSESSSGEAGRSPRERSQRSSRLRRRRRPR